MTNLLKISFLLIFLLIFSYTSFSQDKVILRNDSIIYGKIIFADSSQVIIRKDIRPDGPDYIFHRGELKKIEYQSGKFINYPRYFWEASFGISSGFINIKNEHVGTY